MPYCNQVTVHFFYCSKVHFFFNHFISVYICYFCRSTVTLESCWTTCEYLTWIHLLARNTAPVLSRELRFCEIVLLIVNLCRFQQSAQLQLTGGGRQPDLWSQPLSVPQPSGLWQRRQQHELPVQIDWVTLCELSESSTLCQCLKPKNVIDGLPVFTSFSMFASYVLLGFYVAHVGTKRDF